MWGILTSWEAQSELAQGQGRDLSDLFVFFKPLYSLTSSHVSTLKEGGQLFCSFLQTADWTADLINDKWVQKNS